MIRSQPGEVPAINAVAWRGENWHLPARAALTGVLVPVIALAVSAAFGGWRPSLASWFGMAPCMRSVYVATRPISPAA